MEKGHLLEDTNRHFQTPKRILNVGNLKPDEIGKKVKKWVDFCIQRYQKFTDCLVEK